MLTREEFFDESVDLGVGQALVFQVGADGAHINVGVVVRAGGTVGLGIDDAEIEIPVFAFEDLVIERLLNL